MKIYLFATLLLLAVAPTAFAQSRSITPRKSTGVDFRTLDSNGKESDSKVFEGKGVIPVVIKIKDGRMHAGRKLQAVLAIHKRDMSRPDSAVREAPFKDFVDSSIMLSLDGEEHREVYEKNVEVPPGDYVIYVILCDPSLPVSATTNDSKYFDGIIDLKKLPGAPMRATACTAIVH